MREGIFKAEVNRVVLTGEIRNLPDYVRYVPNPLISFDLISFRNRKSVEEEWKFDENKIVIFDNESFLKTAKEGERYRFVGEVQSRNFYRAAEDMDEIYMYAVQNYHMLTGEYPCEIQPSERKKEVLDWRKLLSYGLIPEAPEDSMFDTNMKKSKSSETPYVYRVDHNGEVLKETQHVTYEVLVKSGGFEKLEDEVHELEGDINRAKLGGRVTKKPIFNYLGQEKPVPFINFNVGMGSKIFPGHMFFINVIAWGKTAEDILQNIDADDYVLLKGRLQSRPYVKKITKRWVTPAGNKKKKEIEIPLKTREVSVSYIEKSIRKEKKDNSAE